MDKSYNRYLAGNNQFIDQDGFINVTSLLGNTAVSVIDGQLHFVIETTPSRKKSNTNKVGSPRKIKEIDITQEIQKSCGDNTETEETDNDPGPSKVKGNIPELSISSFKDSGLPGVEIFWKRLMCQPRQGRFAIKSEEAYDIYSSSKQKYLTPSEFKKHTANIDQLMEVRKQDCMQYILKSETLG